MPCCGAPYSWLAPMTPGTGRVTGPNLHWLASYGNVMVDPLDLLSIDLVAPVGTDSDR